MDVPESDTVSTLLLLLPGFLALEIRALLSVRRERGPMDRVVHALIFTLVSYVLWTLGSTVIIAIINAKWDGAMPERLTPEVRLIGVFVCSIAVGCSVAFCINKDWPHRFLRDRGLTSNTLRPSVWYDAFFDCKSYIVIHLADGRRIYGWPSEFDDEPNDGHVLIKEAYWIRPEGDERPLPSTMLLATKEIRMVEFLSWRNNDV